MKYPLNFEIYNEPNYFEKREVFSLYDFISSPMFLAFVAPIVLLIFLPRLVPQDLEMQNAFQQVNEVFQPQWDSPDLTDICIRLFGGPRRQRPPNE